MHTITRSLLLFFLFNLFSYTHAQLYVDASANGSGDGSSWANAYTDLQDAIDAAPNGSTLWVAAGTYHPPRTPDGVSAANKARERTFHISRSLTLYGGFAGNETLLSERNWQAHPTYLDGTLSGGTYVYRVLLLRQHVSVQLDGFVIQNALANGPSHAQDGAGLKADNLSTLTLRNLTFRQLEAKRDGGALKVSQLSSVDIQNCDFFQNTAKSGGAIHATNLSSLSIVNGRYCGNTATGMAGAIHATQLSSAVLAGLAFTGNSASSHGGTLYFSNGSSAILTNNTFTGNVAGGKGGAIYIKSQGGVSAYNSIFWDNTDESGNQTVSASIWFTNASSPSLRHCLLAGSQGSGPNWPNNLTDNGGNLDADPLFYDLDGPDGLPCTGDEYPGLSAGSPALGMGDPNAPHLPATDFNDAVRVQNGQVDLGASAGPQGNTFPVEWLDLSVQQQGSQGLLSWRTAQEINSSHFIVERTYDQQGLWLALGEVTAQGFSDQPQAYAFTDAQLPLSAQQVYYRLRQVDLDGTWAYSPVLSLGLTAAGLHLSAHPNPNQGQFGVNLTQARPEAGTLRVIDALGRTCYQRALPAASAHQAHINLPQAQPGLYFVEWVTPTTRTAQRVLVR